MFTLDALRALYSRKKTFRVVENRCLQYAESTFVNLPQFAKFGLKESLNRFFWYFSLHLFGYFGLISSFLFLWVFDSLQYFRWRRHRNVRLENGVDGGRWSIHSSPWIRFFNLWRDGKEALGCKFYRQRVFRVPSTSNVDVQWLTKVPLQSVESKTSESI